MQKSSLHLPQRSAWNLFRAILGQAHFAPVAALLLLWLGFAEGLYAQTSPGHGAVWSRVAQARSSGEAFQAASIFDAATKRSADAYRSAVQKGDVFDIKAEAVQALLASQPRQLELAIPADIGGKPLRLELVRVNLFAEDFKFTTSGGANVPFEAGLHYQGAIAGDPSSLAAISIYRGQAAGLIATQGGAYTLGKIKGAGLQHILYRSDDLTYVPNFKCDAPDDGDGYRPSELEGGKSMPGSCPVGLYVEVDYSVYSNFGNDLNATLNFTAALFNQSFVLYANESIAMQLTEVFAWTAPDPYTGPSAGAYLSQFRANIGALNGDVGILITRANVGGSANINKLCDPDPTQPLCVSGLPNLNIRDVPVFSFNVYITTHEIGHVLGSRHTHACVWNGNNTAIDGCSGFTEGGCPLPGSPAGGGTIMSYCTDDPVGVNFTLGFGPQPGNVIRNAVNNAPCLSDGDGDGLCGDNDPCPDDPDNDADGDGICGDIDNCPGTNNHGQADADGDGLGDACDDCPNDPDNDADHDGICGDVDNCPGTNNHGQQDADGDGLGDACDDCPNDPDNDADHDGICGDIDNCPGTNNHGQADADGDGLGDACDDCPNDPDNDADHDGICGDIDSCPDTANPNQEDLDQDGLGDACDPSTSINGLVYGNLIPYIENLGLNPGIERALTRRLDLAAYKFCRGNPPHSIIAQLNSFITYVQHQSGNQIPEGAADHIIAQVQGLIDAMNADAVDCSSFSRPAPPTGPGQIAAGEALQLQASPNPFREEVSIRLYLPEAGPATLAVFNLNGRQVATLHSGYLDAGEQRFSWNGAGEGGRQLSAGAYLVRLQAEGGTLTQKVSLVR